MPGGISLEAGMRQPASAAALVEQHDAVARGVVVAAHGGVAASARSTVHDQRRLAAGIAAFLEVDFVAAADLQPLLAIGLDRWIETEPLPCRHRLAFPVLVLVPGPVFATCNRYMRAGELCKLPAGNVEAEDDAIAGASAGRAVPETQQAHLPIVYRLSAGHPHVADDV